MKRPMMPRRLFLRQYHQHGTSNGRHSPSDSITPSSSPLCRKNYPSSSNSNQKVDIKKDDRPTTAGDYYLKTDTDFLNNIPNVDERPSTVEDVAQTSSDSCFRFPAVPCRSSTKTETNAQNKSPIYSPISHLQSHTSNFPSAINRLLPNSVMTIFACFLKKH